MTPFQLHRNPHGQLVCTDAQGQVHVGVLPVRAFPITAPDEGVSLVSPEGHEVVWIERLSDLPSPLRRLIEEELAQREFMPEITRLVAVSSFATPSTWEVETDRGRTQLVLKGEEDIRRLPGGRLLIADRDGVSYLIRDPAALDRASRRLLDRFL
ncbi:MAG: hypothetical protein KatS3mg122_2737 [Caldimonas sp.]|uniref:cyanophycin metabolism-associated DUF1854 family protein n=1 Tax=Caldimonas TaxID=196013 RepID=UPI000377C570|nr:MULTISPECIES: DUF1854 domain-containing protein [Caldimonas]GIX25506.1 MAG: hypothetical protein KatS3mg122_2737 [Caldimonas sp.]